MRSQAMSIFLYACETWTRTADIERRIQALEMRCFRKLLGILYRDHITNEEVKARIDAQHVSLLFIPVWIYFMINLFWTGIKIKCLGLYLVQFADQISFFVP